MKTSEALIDQRLEMAMKPLDELTKYPTIFNWRIRAILEKSKWKRRLSWDDVNISALKDCEEWDLYVLLEGNYWRMV